MSDWSDEYDDAPPPQYEDTDFDEGVDTRVSSDGVGGGIGPAVRLWNDKFFILAFIIYFVIMIILAIVGASSPKVPSTVVGTTIAAQTTMPSGTLDPYEALSQAKGALVGSLIILAVLSCVLCAIFIFIMRKNATALIYASLGVGILINIVAAIVFFAKSLIPVGIMCCIFAGLSVLWFFFVRHRIPFTAIMIETVAAVTKQYPAPVYIGFALVPAQLLWVIIWSAMTISMQASTNVSGGFTMVLSLLHLWWVLQVLKNISHCTTAGLFGSWYFQSDDERPTNPTIASLKRAVSSSLGSIMCGSLIVAFIKLLRALCRNIRILRCLLGIIDRVVRYFNSYAYVHISLYGTNFITSAKDTFDLFKTRGITVIVNDWLVGGVISLVGIVIGILSGLIGFVLPYAFAALPGSPFLGFLFAIIGFLMGFSIASVIFNVLESGSQTLMVGICKSPERLQQLRPQLYDAIQNAYPGVLSLV